MARQKIKDKPESFEQIMTFLKNKKFLAERDGWVNGVYIQSIIGIPAFFATGHLIKAVKQGLVEVKKVESVFGGDSALYRIKSWSEV